jgi:hypothetical protein
VAKRGVAVLCRMAFLESAARYDLHFGAENGLTVMAPFIERVPMQLGSWDPKGSTATAYAWFVYDKQFPSPAPVIRPIPPGTRVRLTRADDAARFGVRASQSLFERGSDDAN